MTNYDYRCLTEEEAEAMTKEHLVFMYNDSVEMIWHLNHRIEQLMKENEEIWSAYDELSNKYLG